MLANVMTVTTQCYLYEYTKSAFLIHKILITCQFFLNYQYLLQRKVKNITTDERSKTQNIRVAWVHLYEISRKGNTIETESSSVITWGWEQALNANEHEGTFQSDEMFYNWIMVT